jgi:EAL domain-containing protein (putative c-di-GMP-specific phosphodiesterase class I)
MQRLESADAADRLDKYSLPAGALELEIPESVIMLDPERARTVLNALRRLGLRIAIDDYGTGYCALSYLQDLPVDELKLDRSFAARVATDARSAAIVRSTIELAHALGLQVVAEGVEDRQTLDAVTSFGCDYAQGYYFSRPVPAAAFAAAVRLSDVDPGAEPSPLPPSLGGQLCSPRAVGPSHRRDHIGWASQEPGLAG